MSNSYKPDYRTTDVTCECTEGSNQNRDLPRIDQFDFSWEERAILDVVRYLSCGIAVEDYDGLARGLSRADEEWGDVSHRVLEALSYLLWRLQAVRTEPFEFIISDCSICRQRICQSELELMWLIRAARNNDAAKLRGAAKAVAVSGKPDSLIQAAIRAARVLEACQPVSVPTVEQRVLH